MEADLDTSFSYRRTTNWPAISNPKLPAEGSASFSNLHLALSILLFPRLLQAVLPFPFRISNSWTWYFFLVALFGVPVAIGYWWVMSRIGRPVNEKCILPGKGLEGYVTIKDEKLRRIYGGVGTKIPMEVFHEAFFDGKLEFNGKLLISSILLLEPMTKLTFTIRPTSRRCP
jgi:hypothetical protein